MDVRHKQREHIRLSVPAVISIDKHQYAVRDWSLGGFKLQDFDQDIAVGDCLPVHFHLSLKGGFKFSVNTVAEVVWNSREDGTTGFRFLNLRETEKQLLKYVIITLQEEQLKPEDFIAEVNGSSKQIRNLEFLQKRASPTINNKRKFKFFLNLLVALTIGGVVGYYTLLTLYRAVIHIEIKSAVVIKPIEPIISTHRGIISQLYVQEGMKIKAGQPLLRMYDQQMAQFIAEDKVRNIDLLIRQNQEQVNRLNEQIELSRLDISKAKFELRNTEALRQQEIRELRYSQEISQDKLDAAKAKVTALTTQYREAQKHFYRLEFLWESGAISKRALESARANFAEIEGKLEAAKKELEIAQTVLRSIPNGSFYNGDRFVGELPRLTAEVKDASERVKVAEQKIRVLERERKKYQREIEKLNQQKPNLQLPRPKIENSFDENIFSTVYPAPVSGTVVKIHHSSGSPVNIGKTLLLLQPELTRPKIEAYLTQDQVAQLGIGSQVTVIIPELNKSYPGEVVVIDRRGGFFDKVRGKYQFEGSINNPANIEVAIADIPKAEESQLMAGMPVRLKFTKKLDLFSLDF
ncbi:MAG: HlyD family efflux transporter periplasmic adaptor subunit [Xenococcaceae cyanobacterium]